MENLDHFYTQIVINRIIERIKLLAAQSKHTEQDILQSLNTMIREDRLSIDEALTKLENSLKVVAQKGW